MPMKLQPVRENLLCKTLYNVCHSSSFGLPFKRASFMKPNYFGTLCAFHLYRSHQKSCTDFLILNIIEKKMKMKLQLVCENLLCKPLYKICHIGS